MERADTFAICLARQTGLFIDDLNPTNLFGCYGGYHMILRKQGSGSISVQLSAKQAAETADGGDKLHELMERESVIYNASIRDHNIKLMLRIRYGARTQVGNLIKVLNAITEQFAQQGYESCCEHCGTTKRDIKAFMLHGVPSLLCEQCYWDLEDTGFGIGKHLAHQENKNGLLRRVYAGLLPFLQRHEHGGRINYQMRSAAMEWERRTGNGPVDQPQSDS